MTSFIPASLARAERARRRELQALIEARNAVAAPKAEPPCGTFVLPDDFEAQIRAVLGLPRVVTVAEVGAAVAAIHRRHVEAMGRV